MEGEVELTPIQERFFEEEMINRNHYNQSVMLTSRRGIDVEALTKAVGKLVEQHDALRMRYHREEDGRWHQENGHLEEVEVREVVEVVEVRGKSKEERSKEIEEVAEEAQKRLEIEKGRVVKVVVMKVEEERERVLMVVHHLVVDVVSWRVLIEDLERGYEQAKRGEEVRLGSKSTSMKQWSRRLRGGSAK